MLRYALSRVMGAIPTLFILVTLAFFLVRLAPGGPFDRERALPPEVERNLAAAYHLDEPLPLQYLRYLQNLAQGDFGPSFKYKDFSVTELILGGFPTSLLLGGTAMVLACILGIGLGLVAAVKRERWPDSLVMALATTGIALPNFVVAPLLTLVFGLMLGWLQMGWGSSPTQMILPVIALALPQVAYIARLTRASLVEVLRSPFIRMARAKGMPEKVVLLRHALRPALLPVVSYLGPATAAIVTGSVVIEQIFGIPGIGRYFIQGALNRDYTLVLGVVIFYGVLIIAANLIVDLAYGLLDPKVRHG
ncbi:oligopeptide ABC transporter permease OppB [Zavarzinia sp. CC-PAN008]|uniref:oligopeptide ABC transporter permease OppB n=1 Tax=Zavarzinia sp. CC-PAN008 TaxID=3243332 RepID=UPI003F749470